MDVESAEQPDDVMDLLLGMLEANGGDLRLRLDLGLQSRDLDGQQVRQPLTQLAM